MSKAKIEEAQRLIADDSFYYAGDSLVIMDIVNAIKAGYRIVDTNGDLGETIEGMLSDDYIERLKAEYKQLTTRINKLKKYISHYKPKVRAIELYLLEKQLNYMIEYRNVLELRASLDIIDLNEGTNLD